MLAKCQLNVPAHGASSWYSQGNPTGSSTSVEQFAGRDFQEVFTTPCSLLGQQYHYHSHHHHRVLITFTWLGTLSSAQNTIIRTKLSLSPSSTTVKPLHLHDHIVMLWTITMIIVLISSPWHWWSSWSVGQITRSGCGPGCPALAPPFTTSIASSNTVVSDRVIQKYSCK